MIVIRRMVDRQRSYTGIFLPGEPPNIFPTSDAEHARILAIYKQERRHEGIINDFSDYALGSDHLPPTFQPAPRAEPTPTPVAATGKKGRPKKSRPPKNHSGVEKPPSSLWLVPSGEKM